MAAWTRAVMPGLAAVLAVAGCASQPGPTATPLVPSAGAGAPVASAVASAPATGPALEPAPSRRPLDVGAGTGSDVIVTGALDPHGSYRIRSVIPELRDLGVIPDIEARIQPPWTLLDSEWTTPGLSDTGLLALPLTSGPQGDENAAVGVFDLLDPDSEPRVFEGSAGGFRLAGDRLWMRSDEREFTIHDLPGSASITITVPADRTIPRGRSVPFHLTDDGGSVLVRNDVDDGGLRLLDLAGAERAVPPDQDWLLSTGVEIPFGPGHSVLRTGPCDGGVQDDADLCVVDAAGHGTAYDVPGRLLDAAWDPGEQTPTWLSTKGVGTITDGAVRTTVRLADWRPDRIAGFWSNVVILASDMRPRVAFAVLGADAITELPMPADSLVTLDGDVLLRVVPGADLPD